jgi:DNA-binding response OmpR family regulator
MLRLKICQLTFRVMPRSHWRAWQAVEWHFVRNVRKEVPRNGLIVIHEGDDLIRELLERWLSEAGYCLHAAADETPCLVIADAPSPRGAQPMIEALRAVYAAPIMVLSGRFRRGLGGSAEAARRLGVMKVLPKPFTRKELLSAVNEALKAAG